MGFGSYDESEQENQEIDTENINEDGIEGEQANHEGSIEFDFAETSNEELVDRLQDIKD
ncbi:MAG: DUF5786 family protein [Halobacteriaceae archaeon]